MDSEISPSRYTIPASRFAYQRAKGPKNLVTIPKIQHYGVYMQPAARQQARDLAIAWFDKYLKGAAGTKQAAASK